MTDLSPLIAANAARWAAMHVVTEHVPEIDSVAHRLVSPYAKSVYQAIEALTVVPWYFIAVVHEREASQSWFRSIAQGDPLAHRSVNVPAGRIPPPAQPPFTFKDAAVDALVNCAPFAARNKDWSMGGLLTLLESYNGLGYFRLGKPSPYIWAASDQYVSGKYIRDHVYDPNVVDTQLGCAPLLARMAVLDASIVFSIAPPTNTVPLVVPAPPTAPEPQIVHDEPIHQPARLMPPETFGPSSGTFGAGDGA